MCARCPTIHHCSTVPGVKYKYLSPAVSISPQQQPGCHCFLLIVAGTPGPLLPSPISSHSSPQPAETWSQSSDKHMKFKQAGRQHCSWLDNIIGLCECLTPQLVRVLLAWLVWATGRQTHENIQTSYQQSASQRRFGWDAKILIQMGRKIPIVPPPQTVSCKGVTLTRPSVNT